MQPSQLADSATPKPATGNSETLLAAFQRPPEASGEGINSAVIIAAEPADHYPNLKTAAGYFGPLSEVAEQRGLKIDGAPYGFAVGTKQLVRGDFTLGNDKPAVWQTSLVMIAKRYIVSFTFLSGSKDEIEDLIAGLNFGAPARTPSGMHK